MLNQSLNIFHKNSLLKLFSGSFVVRISYTLLGFINSVLLARFLGADDYGIYVFTLSIVALLSVPTQFGMPILVIREFAAFQAQERWDLMKGLALRSHQFVIATAAAICGIAFLWLWLNHSGYTADKQNALMCALLLVPVLSLGALRDAMLRGLRHIMLAQLSESIIRPLLLMLALAVAMFAVPTTASVADTIALYAACSLTAFVAGWLMFSKRKPRELTAATPSFNTQAWFAAALPIGLMGAVQVINVQLSTVLLGFYATDAEVAFYRVAALAAGFIVIILQVNNSVVSPYFSRLYAQNDLPGIEALVAKTNTFIVLATVPLVVAIVALSPWLLVTFYGADFSASYAPLLLLTAGQTVNVLTGSVAFLLIMTGHQKDVTKATTIALVLNIVLHVVLLPRFGLLGAAFSSMTMLIVWNALMWIKVKQRLKIRYFF